MSKNKFEDKVKELEKIVTTLEKGEIELDESVRLFEKGMKLSRDCSQDLTRAEKRVSELIRDEMSGEMISRPWSEME